MNNESIKEISDKIKKCLIAGYDVDIITQDELNILWNYITNLQQEKEDYKSKVEKAIEYINEEFDCTGVCISGSDLPYSYIEDLLNILQGENNE